jgi:hypothetical protein
MVGRMFVTTTTTVIYCSKFPAHILGSTDLPPGDKAGKNVTWTADLPRYRHWPLRVSVRREIGSLEDHFTLPARWVMALCSVSDPETWALLSYSFLVRLSLQLCYSLGFFKRQRKWKCVIRDNKLTETAYEKSQLGKEGSHISWRGSVQVCSQIWTYTCGRLTLQQQSDRRPTLAANIRAISHSNPRRRKKRKCFQHINSILK